MLTCIPETHIKELNIEIFILKITCINYLKGKILYFQCKTSIFKNLNMYI